MHSGIPDQDEYGPRAGGMPGSCPLVPPGYLRRAIDPGGDCGDSSLAHWRSASCISAAEWKRTSGSFSRTRITISSAAGGTLALNWRKGGGFVDACCIAIETAVGPTNGGRPVSISNITTPSEYRSEEAVSRSPLACSGER